jgi:hypothetical protein
MDILRVGETIKQNIVIECIECKQNYRIMVEKYNYEEWIKTRQTVTGRYIQDIFWYLTPGEREMFMTKICDTCFKYLLGTEFEDKDEE